MPLKRDLEQRNLWSIIPLQAKFPTPDATVQTGSDIRVWGLPILYWVLSLSLGGLCLASANLSSNAKQVMLNRVYVVYRVVQCWSWTWLLLTNWCSSPLPCAAPMQEAFPKAQKWWPASPRSSASFRKMHQFLTLGKEADLKNGYVGSEGKRGPCFKVHG